MVESTKRLFIGGNWKCNNTLVESKLLVENVLNKLSFDENRVGKLSLLTYLFIILILEVIVAPVFVQIPFVLDTLNKNVQVAAQDCSATGFGAFTGEIA